MKTKTLHPKETILTDEWYAMADELEAQWRKSWPRLTERQWLDIFPEASEIAIQKIIEWKTEIVNITEEAKYQIPLIKQATNDPLLREILTEWSLYWAGARLAKIKKHIARLYRLRSSVYTPEIGSSTEALLEQAREASLLDLAQNDFTIKKNGNSYRALCPFHSEKTPSFFIFPSSNRFKCFGCNQSGDVIDYFMHTRQASFPEAVKALSYGGGHE